ncbi:MAG: hypothetical protein JNM27_08675 [Leptospirales bacterium]|nr:hypothetical protein [Leptospirales bacterium]
MKAIRAILTVLLVWSCTPAFLNKSDKSEEALRNSNLALAASLLSHSESYPAAFVYNNTVTPLANGASVFVTYNTVSYDTGNFFNTAASDRLTIPMDGVYFVQGWLAYQPNASGSRKILLYANTDAAGATGSLIATVVSPASSAGEESVLEAQTVYRFVRGDYIKLRAYQSSGGSLNLTVSGYSQVLYARRISN